MLAPRRVAALAATARASCRSSTPPAASFRLSKSSARGFPVPAAQRSALSTSVRPPAAPAAPVVPVVNGASGPQLSDSEMARRLLRSQRVWWWLGSLALAGVTLVAFGPELKMGMSKHTAEVASRSLQDETLQNNTRELASQIVQTVLNDPKVLDQASQFLQRLVVMDATREALRALVVHTLQDPQTLHQVSVLSKQVLAALIEDPKTLKQLVDLLSAMTLDPRAKEALLKLLEQLMRDENTRRNLTQLLAFTFVQEPVKKSVTKSLGDSVHDLLSRNDVQTHAKEFVGSVVRDQTVQAQSGDAIWSSVMYAITPSWLAWIWQQDSDEAATASSEAEEIVAEAVAAVEQQHSNADKAQAAVDSELNASPARSAAASATVASATAADRLARATTKPLVAEVANDQQKSEDVSKDVSTTASTSRRRWTTKLMSRKPTGSSNASKDNSHTHKREADVQPARAEFSDADDGERHWNHSGSGFL